MHPSLSLCPVELAGLQVGILLPLVSLVTKGHVIPAVTPCNTTSALVSAGSSLFGQEAGHSGTGQGSLRNRSHPLFAVLPVRSQIFEAAETDRDKSRVVLPGRQP